MFVIWEGSMKRMNLDILWDHNRKSKIGYPYTIATKKEKYCNYITGFIRLIKNDN